MSTKPSQNIGEVWSSLVSEHPNIPALRLPSSATATTIRFAELDSMANRLAACLARHEIGIGEIILIASTKDADDYALMIACLRSGITYAHLDTENPIDRHREIIKLCSPCAVFGLDLSEDIQDLCREFNVPCIHYRDIEPNGSDSPECVSDVSADTIAYVMFTSGSTGAPKGVAISHGNLLPFITWARERYALQPGQDCFAQLSPLYFDNSVFDFFGGLLNGAALVPIDRATLSDPLALLDQVEQGQCSIWFSVPSLLIFLMRMRVLQSDRLQHIRVFTFGGEGYPKPELKKLYDLYGSRADLINVYGPTEGTCICSSYTINEQDFENQAELPSLGTLNPGFRGLVMKDGVTVASGQPGELFILGPQIASGGYFGDPARTEQSFSTYVDETGARWPMYQTGDVVELRDGNYHFRGRTDHQIKHMGYRIELGEIEAALNSINLVQQAAVVYQRGPNAPFGKIVAFICLEAHNGLSLLEEIKSGLSAKLPNYMLPGAYEVIENLPKNANGKVDRKALASMC